MMVYSNSNWITSVGKIWNNFFSNYKQIRILFVLMIGSLQFNEKMMYQQ